MFTRVRGVRFGKGFLTLAVKRQVRSPALRVDVSSQRKIAADVFDGDNFTRIMMVFGYKRPHQFVILARTSLFLRQLLIHFSPN